VGLGSRAAMVLKVIDQLRARRRERGSAEP